MRIKPRKKKRKVEDLDFPTLQFENVARSLKNKIDLDVRETRYAPVKEVLTMLAGGIFLASSFIMPGLALGLKAFINEQNDGYVDKKEWRKFNPSYLARTLKRLEKQKLVEIVKEGELNVVVVTDRGRRRVLKYELDELEIKKPKIWDGRWYFVTYDIPRGKNWLRDEMRKHLERLGFYRFHESLYIHAYSCEDEIDFLREYFGVAEFVKVLTVNRIENDRVFREYFGI